MQKHPDYVFSQNTKRRAWTANTKMHPSWIKKQSEIRHLPVGLAELDQFI